MKQKIEVINLRIDSEVKQIFETIAKEEERTLAGQIRASLWDWYRSTHYYKDKIDTETTEANNGI
jgi:hypothetical protein